VFARLPALPRTLAKATLMPDSREILDRLSKIDVRQSSGQYEVKTAPRKPRLRRAVETVRPWSLGDVITIALTLLIAGVISSLILSNRLTSLLPAVGKVWVRVALLLVFYAIELGVLALLAYRRKLPFVAAYRLRSSYSAPISSLRGVTQSRRGNPVSQQDSATEATLLEESSPLRRPLHAPRSLGTSKMVVLVIVLSILLRLAGFGWTLLAPQLGWATPQSESMTYLFGATPAGIIAAVLTVALIGPFIEELAFRVIMQEWFAARLPILLSAVVTSVIFAASHFSLWALALNLLLGVATSYFAYKSKTIWPAVILHVVYNATVVLAAFYFLLH